MFSIRKSFRDFILAIITNDTKIQEILNNEGITLEVVANNSRTKLPSFVYEYTETSEDESNISNGLFALTLLTPLGSYPDAHAKIIQIMKYKCNEASFDLLAEVGFANDTRARLVFNSLDKNPDRQDVESTTLSFEVRYFIDEE